MDTLVNAGKHTLVLLDPRHVTIWVLVLMGLMVLSLYLDADPLHLLLTLRSWISSWIPGSTLRLCSGLPGPCF